MLANRSLLSKAGALAAPLLLGAAVLMSSPTRAQDRLPWDSPQQSQAGTGSDTVAARSDVYTPDGSYSGGSTYPKQPTYRDDAYRPDDAYRSQGNGDAYVPPPSGSSQAYRSDEPAYTPDYAPYPETAPQPYEPDYGPPPPEYDRPPPEYGEPPPPAYDDYDRRTYSRNEVLEAGHAFFGSVSRGLASVVEYAFERAGRPNGYILGEDAG